MRATPIYTLAARATFERFLGLGHVGRYLRPHRVELDRFQWLIAHRTARKRGIRFQFQIQIQQHLGNLSFQVFTGNQENAHTSPPGQVPVTSEEYAILGPGQPYQLVIVQLGIE